MSWMKRLYDVYENNIDHVGTFEARGKGQRFTLLPISHVTQSAHIEVLLDQEGNFFKATVVPKDKSSTIVPATLGSANRAGARVAPHFLHDKLFYVAGDYLAYGGEEKRAAYFPAYIEQMKEWALSLSSHAYVRAIYTYVAKERLIEDLVKEGILFTDENDEVIEKWTTKETEKYDQEKPEFYKVVTGQGTDALVRFTIVSEDPHEPILWENVDLYANFQAYLAEKMEEEQVAGYCYVTGKQVPLTEQHGSRLRNAGDMSKLISSNDHRGFTYRGRFNEPSEAVQIGYEVSQKAHNALRWLIQKQGFRSDTRNFITFGVEGLAAIQPFDGTKEVVEEDFDDFLVSFAKEKEDDTVALVLGEEIEKAFQGKNHHFNEHGIQHVVVMAVDAATTGRLAIVYYQEVNSRLFLDRLSHWHHTCKWHQNYYDANGKMLVQYIGTPSTYHIVQAVYGEKADDKVKKELYTRLLPCIVDRAPIPKDIVRTIFNRVKNPMSFDRNTTSPTSEWQRTLNIACALIHKLYEREAMDVGLDVENHARDYLFGRLLGVAEVLERNELQRREEKRATNATRYFSAFSQRPARTWKTMRHQLNPYLVRQGDLIYYYNNLIIDIESSIDPKDMNNDSLGPLFLLGYSSQIKDLYTKKDEKGDRSHVTNSK